MINNNDFEPNDPNDTKLGILGTLAVIGAMAIAGVIGWWLGILLL